MTDEQHPLSDEERHATAERIDQAFTVIERPVTQLYVYTRRTRRLVVGLAISVVFDLIISVIAGVLILRVKEVAHQAEELTQQVETLALKRSIEACKARNDYKALDLKRWQKLIDINNQPYPDETAAQRAATREAVADFKKFIYKADKPENCNRLQERATEPEGPNDDPRS